MTEINFKSAGVSARTINLTGPTALSPVGVPAGVVGTAAKGPAFVPMTIPTTQDFIVVFGRTTDGAVYGPLAVSEWLRNQQAATFIRVLGIGTGAARTTAGQNKGKVTNAGFVVGDQQPQSTLSGALGSNVYAVTSSANGVGPLGRTYFLGAFHSQSNGSTWFSDAGLTGSGVPLIRGMLMAASGVVLTLSNSAGGNNYTPSTTGSGATQSGFQTGSVTLTGGKQEFVMFLNGHKAADLSYPNIITASFDPTAPNYFGSILNKDAYRLEQAGYVMYSHWDLYPSVATVTGSGAIPALSGGTGVERVAFMLTGSQTRNSGSTVAPNFENFEDRFRTAKSPWVTSQLFGGFSQNLFRVHALSDGVAGNNYKISIENVAPSLSDVYRYGKFDLLVRSIDDTDRSRVVLEQWRGLSLDPDASNYIARVIGETNAFYNFEASDGEQKLVIAGDYPNNSKYVRVEMAVGVVDKEVDPTALPIGFRGNQHLVTSGTAPMGPYSDSTMALTNPWYRLVQPPVPMRKNLSRGASGNTNGDRLLYWGVQFEKVISVSESNASYVPDDSIKSFMKYYPNYHTDWQNVVVSANELTADTAANGILDADRFNNNAFSLEKVQVAYISASNIPDVNNLDDWSYVRQGGITADTVLFTRALTVADLEDPTVRQVCKFSFFVEGGFDGQRMFDRNEATLTNAAVVEELSNGNRLLSSGPSVKAYERALSILNDTSEVDLQLLTVPGIRHRYITDQALAVAENRFDAMYIMDIEEKDTVGTLVTSDDQIVSVRNTVNNFRDRGLNSSFGAAYFPNVIMRDGMSNVTREVPPSVAVLGAFSKNDAVAFPWFAPAGFTRGALDSTQEAAVKLSRGNMDDLQQVNINPLVAFPGSAGTVVWGQKTLLASQSALERVNVRRLLLTLRRQIKKVSNRFLFEPNRPATLARFQQLCQPILKRVQDQQGVENYLVKIDTTTTTQVDIENKTIRGKIFIVPVRTLEFLALDFVLTNAGNFSIT